MPKVVPLQRTKAQLDRGGRPAVISREKILDVARKMEWHDLTMNALAERLGVKKPSLYYHFSSKQDLVSALGAEAVREMKFPAPNSAEWRKWLEQATTAIYAMLCANQFFLGLDDWSMLTRIAIPVEESVLETLEGAGFDLKEAAKIWSFISSYSYTSARSYHMAQQADLDRMSKETAVLLAEAERTRPIPRVLALLKENGSFPEPRERFVRNIAWQIKILPDPQPKKRARRTRK